MTDDLEEYRRIARSWIAANLRLRTPEDTYDPRGFTPEMVEYERSIQRVLFDSGYAGISWPVAYGGQGLTAAHEQAFEEEARDYRLPNFGALGRQTFGICVPTLLAFAPESFLADHVPRVLRGEELWVQFFSEPAAGSDLAGVRTRATRHGDGWRLNGAKTWSSGAYYANFGLCIARTNMDVPKHRGLTWFVVKVDAPGVTVRPIVQINGDAEFCEEFFDDVEVPDSHRIGAVDDGWTVTRTLLAFERAVGSRNLAPVDKTAPDIAPDMQNLARRVKRPKEAHVRQLIARAHIIDLVQRELTGRVTTLGAAGVADASSLAAYPKLAAGTLMPERARIGMEIGRNAAILWDESEGSDSKTARIYLSARSKSIAGGTNEMMRNVIGERLLGLPREVSFDADVPFGEVIKRAASWDPSQR